MPTILEISPLTKTREVQLGKQSCPYDVDDRLAASRGEDDTDSDTIANFFTVLNMGNIVH